MTSVKELAEPLMVYLLLLFWYAVRATTRFDPGTISYASGPGYERLAMNKWFWTKVFGTYQVENFTEVNFNSAEIEVLVAGRVMDQLRKLALTHFRSTVSKNE